MTTAATIWIVMAIGLACGSMNFILAIGSTLLIVIVLTVFRKVETRINKRAPLFVVKAKLNTPIASKILEAADELNCTVTELQIELVENEEIEATFLLTTRGKEFDRNSFIARLETAEGVIHVGVMNNHKQ